MQKKIIFTVTTDLNHDQRMQRICTSLQNHGYNVLLVGRKKSNSTSLLNQDYKQKRINCFFERSFLFYLEYNFKLFLFLLFTNVDIISTVDLDTVLPGYIISKWRNKKIVYDAHEYFTELPELNNRPLVQKVWNAIANTCLPHIMNSYTVNMSLANIFEEKYHIKYSYIRSITKFVELEEVVIPSRSKYILYQGALNVGRGLEVAIEAMKEIDQNIQLLIAGDGDIKNELVKLVKSYRLEQQIVFLGNLNPVELRDVTRNAFIGLNLLASHSLNYYYSLANKFFDYVHAGIPSINMDFPEYRLLNDQYKVGLLVKDLDVKKIVDAINQLIDDKEFYQELQANCLNAREDLSWDKEEVKLLKIYNGLYE